MNGAAGYHLSSLERAIKPEQVKKIKILKKKVIRGVR